MKRLNNKGYLTVEIILASVIAFTIAFFLIEITVNFSNASDNYYVDTIFLTDKSLITDNIKNKIQDDINNIGIITDITCTNNTCAITYNDEITKSIIYNENKEIEYDGYEKKIENVTFNSISVSGSFNENDYIRIVISFDNVFTNNNYDINILIVNNIEQIVEPEPEVEPEIETLGPISEYITNLYLDNINMKVINNEIEYQYATSVNLMNDRLGGTTTSLDGGNIRYYGSNPNNYIKFNNELWRIIGVFDGKIKIIRNNSIPPVEILKSYSWDTSAANINDGNGINQWGISEEYRGADLMKLLNPGYNENQDLNSEGNTIKVNNSLYWNKSSGFCYDGKGNETVACDFSNVGLSNDSKSFIENSTWYTGSISNMKSYPDVVYNDEKNNTVNLFATDGVKRTTRWTGYVGLINMSDFGYAADFDNCNNVLEEYNCNSNRCGQDNWLNKSIISLNGFSVFTSSVQNTTRGISDCRSMNIYLGTTASTVSSSNIHPVVHLKNTTELTGGDGTVDNPYTIK